MRVRGLSLIGLDQGSLDQGSLTYFGMSQQ